MCHEITIRCDDCHHKETFTTDSKTAKVGGVWEQPCNGCGYNWSMILEVEDDIESIPYKPEDRT